MTIWERKKERKKQAMIISLMLGIVVCHDGNDRADLDTKKDIERNTERVHRGELSILYQHVIRRTNTLSSSFPHQSPPTHTRYISTLA
jgi:hypothetical protein